MQCTRSHSYRGLRPTRCLNYSTTLLQHPLAIYQRPVQRRSGIEAVPPSAQANHLTSVPRSWLTWLLYFVKTLIIIKYTGTAIDRDSGLSFLTRGIVVGNVNKKSNSRYTLLVDQKSTSLNVTRYFPGGKNAVSRYSLTVFFKTCDDICSRSLYPATIVLSPTNSSDTEKKILLKPLVGNWRYTLVKTVVTCSWLTRYFLGEWNTVCCYSLTLTKKKRLTQDV